MRFKRVISGLCIGFVLMTLNTSFYFAATQQSPVRIFVNDEELSVYDTEVKKNMPALIVDGRTVMPLKKTFELFGLSVKWDANKKSIEAVTAEGRIIWLQIGNKNARVGDKTVVLDVPARVIDNRTYVPLAFIAKAVGQEAQWDAKNKVVNLYTDGTEQLNLAAIPKVFSNIPSRVNNSIFFDSTTSKSISVTKSEMKFANAVNTLSSILFVQNEDFRLMTNTADVQVAVYEDVFQSLTRSNVVISKSGHVYIIEVRGMNGKEASEFAAKLIK